MPDVEAEPAEPGAADDGAKGDNVAQEEGIRVKDHPEYQRFLKFTKLGMPPAAVRQKMMVEAPHLDPTLLDTPDAFVGDAAAPAADQPPPPTEQPPPPADDDGIDAETTAIVVAEEPPSADIVAVKDDPVLRSISRC